MPKEGYGPMGRIPHRSQDEVRMQRAGTEAGFSLVEVLLAVGLLAGALFAHVGSVIEHHALASAEAARSRAVLDQRQFLERLRADTDWGSLYGRLRTLQDRAALGGVGGLALEDGRVAWPPTAYVDAFEGQADMWVLVDVPHEPSADGKSRVLREDVTDATYLLPADLNGDGTVSGGARDGDYSVLPIRVTFSWKAPGGSTRESSVVTWLRERR